MLKPIDEITNGKNSYQPPSGGCVLKPERVARKSQLITQPPSGGCVLKPYDYFCNIARLLPAAFGRLCVETVSQTARTESGCSSRLRAAVC